MRMQPLLAIGGVLLAAAVVGVALTQPVIALLIERGAVHNGPWRSSASTGSAAGNPYERAAVALAGLYALTRDEAIYFTAFTDSQGAALRGDCRYRVRGRAPSARWWSLTAYGADHYLIPNPQNLFARHARNLPVQADGSFEMVLSSAATSDHSRNLPIPASGPFSLTMRLYNPTPEVRMALDRVPLPRIEREACP